MQQERRQSVHPLLQGRISWVLSVVLLLAACSSTRWDHTPQHEHVVRSGETLFTIGWRYGKDYRDLAEWNRLGNGSLIYPGQVLRLTPPADAAARRGQPEPVAASRPLPPIPTDDPPPWIWPTAGTVAVSFGDRPGSATGILIDGTLNQRIFAAADGRVVYSGSGLIGYGRLIIIKHNDTYLSAYGHNASLLVKEGDSINKGQRIATMGEGPGRKPRLHFEIRRNGKPVNPRQYLPAR